MQAKVPTFQEQYREAIARKLAVTISPNREVQGALLWIISVDDEPSLWLEALDSQQECIDFCRRNGLPFTLGEVPKDLTADF